MGISTELSRKAAIIGLLLSLLVNDGAMGFRAPAIIHGHAASVTERESGNGRTRVPVLLRILNTPVLDSQNPEERFGWNAREMNDNPASSQGFESQHVPKTSGVAPQIPAGLAFSVQMKDAGQTNQDWISEDLNNKSFRIDEDGVDPQGTAAADFTESPDAGLVDPLAAISQDEHTLELDDQSVVLPVSEQTSTAELQAETIPLDDEETKVESTSELDDETPEITEMAQPPEEIMRPPAFARPEACPPSIAMPDLHVKEIKERLSTPTWKESLINIASAFRSDLMVEDIREIRVGTVDESHLDVEALVCEHDDSCVMVQVPVDFPASCRVSDDTSQCILDSLEELNRALKVEEESELFPTEKTLLERERLLKEVVSPKFLEYPSWWSTPVSSQTAFKQFESHRC